MTFSQFKDSLHSFLLDVNLPYQMSAISYADYMSLSDEQRGDDEQDIVDIRLSVELLKLLGYDSADWTYNRNKERNRPDFIIRSAGKVIFFLEDKHTGSKLDIETDQINRYNR